jgi:hypothetical protein
MRVQANGRVRRSRSEWREIFDRFETSGLSRAAFCRREDLSKSSFTKWKTRLADDPAPAAESVPFVDLSSAVSELAAPSLGAGEIEVLLPGGVRIRWKG